MSVSLLPLCKNVRAAMRDGWGGQNAHIYIPFYGYWYADGKILSFPNSNVTQNPAHTISGEYKNLPFNKAAGVCISPNPNG